MERFIAIDSGKFGTKVVEYDFKNNCISKEFQIRTKISDGDLRDDAIEAHTVVVEIDNHTYKVGNGARGTGVDLETNKMTDMHKNCVLTALATIASANEKDEINVAICMPAKDWAVVSKRIDFKEYILPEGDITVSIKTSSSAPVVKKTFTIKSRNAYPEGLGALFADDVINTITAETVTGVLDIGNLNLNALLFQGVDPILDKSSTADLGGSILIEELSQELSTNITTCDEMITASILKNKSDERCFPANANLSPEQIEESKKIIKRVLKEHAGKIKRCCNARNWPINVINIVAIGGTSKDIEEELKEAFGNNLIVLNNPTYVNAYGCLRIMCSKLLDTVIPLTKKEATTEKKTEKAS